MRPRCAPNSEPIDFPRLGQKAAVAPRLRCGSWTTLLSAGAKANIQVGRNAGQGLCIGKPNASALGRKCNQSIKRPAIEQVPAQRVGYTACDSPLAGSARSVNCDYGNALLSTHCLLSPVAVIDTPIEDMHSLNSGNDVLTAATSAIVTAPVATEPATANDMATR